MNEPRTKPYQSPKFRIALVIVAIYFVMLSVSAYGSMQNPLYPIFSGHPGNLLAVGTGPIILTSLLLLFLVGIGAIRIKNDNREQRARFETRYRIAVIIVAVVFSVLFGFEYRLSPLGFGVLIGLQFLLACLVLVYLDRYALRTSFTAGINLFIVGMVIYSIAFRFLALGAVAVDSVKSGGLAALPIGVEYVLPVAVAVLMLWASLLVYRRLRLQVGLVHKLSSSVGDFLPISILFVSLFGLMLAVFIISLTSSLSFAALGSQASSTSKFFATYSIFPGSASPTLTGGIVYMLQPAFPAPYPPEFGGIGSYGAYFTYLASATMRLFLPWGGFVLVPEWVHVVVYILAVMLLTIIITRLWVSALTRRLNIHEDLGNSEWVFGSATLSFLYALGIVLGAGGGYVTAAGVMYVLSQQYGIDLRATIKRLTSGWFNP